MTAGHKVATLLMAVGTVHIACAAVHKQNLLDASTAIVDPEPGHVLESGSGGSIRKTPPPIPIRVRLIETDRKQYRRMEKVLYDAEPRECLE